MMLALFGPWQRQGSLKSEMDRSLLDVLVVLLVDITFYPVNYNKLEFQ